MGGILTEHGPREIEAGQHRAHPESAWPVSFGGGRPPPNCAQATPVIVTAAPAILSQVKDSPSVSQAITPAIGGMRYMKGALRATPRTVFTQVQASQPRNDDITSAQSRPAHTAGPRLRKCVPEKAGNVTTSISGAEKSSV